MAFPLIQIRSVPETGFPEGFMLFFDQCPTILSDRVRLPMADAVK
jgi:hypothetical protein